MEHFRTLYFPWINVLYHRLLSQTFHILWYFLWYISSRIAYSCYITKKIMLNISMSKKHSYTIVFLLWPIPITHAFPGRSKERAERYLDMYELIQKATLSPANVKSISNRLFSWIKNFIIKMIQVKVEFHSFTICLSTNYVKLANNNFCYIM